MEPNAQNQAPQQQVQRREINNHHTVRHENRNHFWVLVSAYTVFLGIFFGMYFLGDVPHTPGRVLALTGLTAGGLVGSVVLIWQTYVMTFGHVPRGRLRALLPAATWHEGAVTWTHPKRWQTIFELANALHFGCVVGLMALNFDVLSISGRNSIMLPAYFAIAVISLLIIVFRPRHDVSFTASPQRFHSEGISLSGELRYRSVYTPEAKQRGGEVIASAASSVRATGRVQRRFIMLPFVNADRAEVLRWLTSGGHSPTPSLNQGINHEEF